jgi:prophage regulatory protein
MLPEIGYIRLPQIIGCPRRGIPAVIPVSQATWFRGIASGKYPAGKLHGPRVRVWSVESIRKLVKEMGE